MSRQAPDAGLPQLSLFDEPLAAPLNLPSLAGLSAAWDGLRPTAAVDAGPASYRHPLAKREIVLNGHAVAYMLRRARRRSIGFIVDADGLSVAAPQWVAQADIELALRDKSRWILRKLAEQHQRRHDLQAARVDWRDGASLPFLGEPLILVLDPRVSQEPGAVRLNSAAVGLPGLPRLTLHIGVSHQAPAAQIRDPVQGWLQRQARRVFEERCLHFAPQLGVRCRRLRLSSAQTRWGSASADGSIRLNWRLIHFGLPVIDYVVVHELAHLLEMNHSPRFWDLVRTILPDFEAARQSLKDSVLPVFD